MRRISVVTLLCLSFTILHAQDQPVVRSNSLKEGMSALQFQVSSDFTLSSFSGSTISWKHQSSPTAAQRIGLSVTGSTSEGSGKMTYPTKDSIFSNQTTNGSTLGVSMVADYILYLQATGDINFYYGAGPVAGITRNYSEVRTTSVTGALSGLDFSTNTSTTWNAGLNGVCGVEWFASSSISLSAEYSGRVYYSHTSQYTARQSSQPYSIGSESNSSSHQIAVSSNNIRFGISAYY